MHKKSDPCITIEEFSKMYYENKNTIREIASIIDTDPYRLSLYLRNTLGLEINYHKRLFIDTLDDKQKQSILDEYLLSHSVEAVMEKLQLSRFKINQVLQFFHIDINIHVGLGISAANTGRIRKTTEEYAEFCEKIDITVLDNYLGVNTEIRHRCKICDHIWKTKPGYVKHNKTGCPKCSIKPGTLSHDDYVLRLAELCPNLEVLGHLVNSNTKILHRCKKCGDKFLKLPAYVATDNGCRKCYTPQGTYGIKTIVDNIEFDSILESRCYLELIKIFEKDEIIHKKWYDNNQYCSDFYIEKLDLWIEVSNFNTDEYLEKIWNKRKLVKNFIFFCNENQIKDYFVEKLND